jgi:hypothetical protein
MVDHDVPDRVATNGIITATDIRNSPAESHVPDDYIMRIDPYRFAGYADTITRR